MILGTYWYFEFPTGLYSFDYFEFKKGLGGHADNPAELITSIEVNDPEKIISELKSLISIYTEGVLFIYREGQNIRIGTGSYQLYDYDFLIISEVEKILSKEKVKLKLNQKLNNPELIKLENENDAKKIVFPKMNLLQLVGSNLKKHNCENSLLRLDCNLNTNNKGSFINELKTICIEENINVLFYKEKIIDNDINLMIFFTNGRQGINFNYKQYIDVISIETKIIKSIMKNNVQLGHLGGYDFYPTDGPNIELIVDEEFIFDKTTS